MVSGPSQSSKWKNVTRDQEAAVQFFTLFSKSTRFAYGAKALYMSRA